MTIIDKCPACEATSFDVFLGHNAYYSDGITVRCTTPRCRYEWNATRAEVDAILVSSIKGGRIADRDCTKRVA